MKILIAVENLNRSGRERRIIELIRGLHNREDISFEVVIFKNLVRYNELQELSVPLHILERKKRRDIFVGFRFISLLKKIKPDIVHSWGGLSSVITLPGARLLGIKTMNSMITNSLVLKYSKTWIRAKLSFPLSGIIASNSRAGIEAYRPPAKKSVVIYNGFNSDRYNNNKSPEEIAENLGIKTPLTFIMVAQFQPQKDWETYLKAAEIVLSLRSDVTFLATGDGPLLEKFKSSVNPAIADRVIFTGVRNDIEAINTIITAGILLTSPTHGEGISNSVMEHMAAARPVIATNNGGTPELVTDNITGFLVPLNDPQAVAEKIIWLIDNREEAEKMGQMGKKAVLERFSINAMVDATLEIYKKLLNGTQ
jgi:glycosyltransferase involved in cell wall biosynthesis